MICASQSNPGGSDVEGHRSFFHLSPPDRWLSGDTTLPTGLLKSRPSASQKLPFRMLPLSPSYFYFCSWLLNIASPGSWDDRELNSQLIIKIHDSLNHLPLHLQLELLTNRLIWVSPCISPIHNLMSHYVARIWLLERWIDLVCLYGPAFWVSVPETSSNLLRRVLRMDFIPVQPDTYYTMPS